MRWRRRLNFLFSFKVGRIVRLFILSDLALLSGWGLVGPVFSLFIVENIAGATVVSVGIAAAIYWLLKSIIQIPIANFLDRTPSEKDDFIFMIMGLILASFAALSFIFIDKIWQLYLVQIIHAVGFGFFIPAWNGVFARHLDEKHRSLDFALDSTAIGLAAGVTGLLSGFLVSWFGYATVFFLAFVFSLVAAAVIFSVPKFVFPHRKHFRGIVLGDHKPMSSSHK